MIPLVEWNGKQNKTKQTSKQSKTDSERQRANWWMPKGRRVGRMGKTVHGIKRSKLRHGHAKHSTGNMAIQTIRLYIFFNTLFFFIQ